MTKTNHPIEPSEMMAYLDGELPVDRAASAAAHLERCSECQAIAADMRAVSQTLLTWQVESSGAGMTPPVAAALATALANRPVRRTWSERLRIRPWMWKAACASAAVLVLAVVMLQRSAYRYAPPASMEATPPAPQAAPPPAQGDTVLAPSGPMIARTASLNLATRSFDQARPAIDRILDRHHGYLASLNITAPAGEPRSLSAAIRVPAADLGATLDELKRLGRVESEQQEGEDVTDKYVDLEARLTNARHTEQRLTDILRDRTGKLSDVLDVEKELDRVRGEIEEMEGQKTAMEKRVALATVNLTVSENGSESGRIGSAAAEGWRNMVASLMAVAQFAASAGPTLLLWSAVLFFPVRYLWRRRRSRLS